MSKGEYICFIDGDDYIELDMLEKLYDCALIGGYDIVDCNYFQEDEDGNIIERISIPNNIIKSNNTRLFIMNCGRVWTKIYKRSFLLENNIKFIENKKFEDNPYLPILMSYSPRVGKVERCFYHYVYNTNSTSRKRNDYSVFDRTTTAEYLIDQAIIRGKYEEYEAEFNAIFIGLYYVNTVIACWMQFDKPEFNYIKKVYYGINKMIPQYKFNPYIKQSPKYYRYIVRMNIIELRVVFSIINLLLKVVGKQKLVTIMKQ